MSIVFYIFSKNPTNNEKKYVTGEKKLQKNYGSGEKRKLLTRIIFSYYIFNFLLNLCIKQDFLEIMGDLFTMFQYFCPFFQKRKLQFPFPVIFLADSEQQKTMPDRYTQHQNEHLYEPENKKRISHIMLP